MWCVAKGESFVQKTFKLIAKKKKKGSNLKNRILFDIPQQNEKLYGGAQLHRLLIEFEYYIHSTEIPKLSENEIMSAFGSNVSSTKFFVEKKVEINY